MTLLPSLDLRSPTNQINQTNETKPTDQLRWYALRTKSRHEKLVRDRLAGHGIEPLLPTLRRMSQWKDRKKLIEVPLFSCYCFARFTWQERLAIQRTFGVVQIVSNGRGPEPIPDGEIQAIRSLMTSKLAFDAFPYLQEGMPVQVIRGPLEGVRGTLLRKDKPFRLVISVHLIRQSASVEIDASDVAPV